MIATSQSFFEALVIILVVLAVYLLLRRLL
jgi:hypothetical protein